MQDLTSFKLPHGFRGRSAVIVQLWWLVQSLLFASSPQFMFRWRVSLLRIFGAEIGENVLIRPSVKVTYPWKLRIGDSTWIGDNVELYTLGNVNIGSNVVVSQKSYICSASHDTSSKAFDIFEKTVQIEDGAWIATDCFIAPGVTIGRGAVIGARSSVYKDMPEGMICMGSPAKPVKKRKMK